MTRQKRSVYQQANLTPQDEPQIVPLDKVWESGRVGQPHSVALLAYDPAQERPDLDWVAILERALAFADWPPDERVDGSLTFGLFAYDEWAETVAAGPGDATVEVAVHLTWPFARRIADKRRAAAVMLARDATLCERFAEAATHYHVVADLLGQMGSALAVGGELALDTLRANFADEDVCASAAELILLARDEEAAAVDALREALAELLTGEGGGPVEGGAEALYQTGLKLKEAERALARLND